MNSIKSLEKKQKIFVLFGTMLVLLFSAYFVLPMLILRDNYIFTVHDTLDSYAGVVEMFHDQGFFYNVGEMIPIMGGTEWQYFTITAYLYDAFNCIFGFVNGQIINRIISFTVGFFSMRYLIIYLFKIDKEDLVKRVFASLISVAYIITPSAVNRTLSFAFLPVIVVAFLHLRNREKFTFLSLFGFLIPLTEQFDAFLVFVVGLWFLFALIDLALTKKFRINVWTCWIFMCISCFASDVSYLLIALFSKDTNRGLYVDARGSFSITFQTVKSFIKYMMYNQSWTPTLHFILIFPFTLFVGLYNLYLFIRKKDEKAKKALVLQIIAYFAWFITAFIITIQEAGFSTGILLIDGFQIGRMIGLMRIVWYLLFALCLFSTFENKTIRTIAIAVIVVQLCYISTNDVRYNDSYETMANQITGIRNEDNLSVTDFFSEELFIEIKDDIQYDYEGVAAYGFHTSVLMYNGFNTIDGYLSVHSMDQQIRFREIIAPTLDKSEKYQSYYDNWGGRMYLFGDLDYDPVLNPEQEAQPLYINTKAFEDQGGRYIISAAEISNAQDINLELRNDYNGDFYHIYLYEISKN